MFVPALLKNPRQTAKFALYNCLFILKRRNLGFNETLLRLHQFVNFFLVSTKLKTHFKVEKCALKIKRCKFINCCSLEEFSLARLYENVKLVHSTSNSKFKCILSKSSAISLTINNKFTEFKLKS